MDETWVTHKNSDCPICADCKHMKCSHEYGYICDCSIDLVKGTPAEVHIAREQVCGVNGRFFQKLKTSSNKPE